MRSFVVAARSAAVTALVLLCGPAAAAGTAVEIKGLTYQPATVHVHPGDTVTWTYPVDPSHTGVPHTVTADDGSFGSADINQSGSFEHTFSSPGAFPYHCRYHESSGMTGTVVVDAPPSASPRSPTASARPGSTASARATGSAQATQSSPSPSRASQSSSLVVVTDSAAAFGMTQSPSPTTTGASPPFAAGSKASGGRRSALPGLVAGGAAGAVLGFGAWALRRRRRA